MKQLSLVTIPNDILFETSVEVSEEEFGSDLKKRMEDMATIMYNNGGVGLSGVQVGDLRRILVADLGHVIGIGYKKELIKMVNPVILESSEETIGIPEGCLSYPGLTQKVIRPKKIRVRYFSPEGESYEEDFEDLQAIVLQHEIDHFNGITLFGRASEFKRRRYKKRVEKILKKYTKKIKALVDK